MLLCQAFGFDLFDFGTALLLCSLFELLFESLKLQDSVCVLNMLRIVFLQESHLSNILVETKIMRKDTHFKYLVPYLKT